MRCVCGYGLEWHEDDSRHCPLCACGSLPAEHEPAMHPPSPLRLVSATGPATWPPSPLLAFADRGVAVDGRVRVDRLCPGGRRGSTGMRLKLRRGSWRDPPPPGRYETRPGWGDILFPVDEVAETVVSEPQALPRVRARYSASLDEIAPRSMPVGRLAAELGWTVDPWYSQAGDGTETCALVMLRGELRAVAEWQRAEGGSWRTAGAYAWHVGSLPTSVGVTKLVDLIKVMG